MTEIPDNQEYKETSIRIWIEIEATDFGDLHLSEKRLVSLHSPSKTMEYDDLDVEFDSRFDIWSEPESFASKVFSSPELRQSLIVGPTPSFVISKSKIGLESKMPTVEKEVEYWLGLIDNLCNVVEAVESAVD